MTSPQHKTSGDTQEATAAEPPHHVVVAVEVDVAADAARMAMTRVNEVRTYRAAMTARWDGDGRL